MRLLFFIGWVASLWGSWSVETLQKMTLEEKIGQLFVVLVDAKKTEEALALFKKYPPGGIIYWKGTVIDQIMSVNTLQKNSKISLFVAQDNEWGLSLRLPDNTPRFPRNLTLGALQDTDLIYKLGKEIARECRLVGVNFNFSPVIDINNNPLNPVISDRSFGENKYDVALKGMLMMKGLQEGGVLTCAKHFPGHGDTAVDSHVELPLLDKSLSDLDDFEWYPFKALIQEKVEAIMMAHLYLPQLMSKKAPSCASPEMYFHLKNELGFKGLILSDALNMKGAQIENSPYGLDCEIIKSGADLLVMPQSFEESFFSLLRAVRAGYLSQEEVEAKVLKILKTKEKIGLHHPYKPLNLHPIFETPETAFLKKETYQKALTLIKNKNKLIPLKKAPLVIQFSKEPHTAFAKACLSKGTSVITYTPGYTLPSGKDPVVVALFDMHKWKSKNFNLSKETVEWILKAKESRPLILVIFGNPYSLSLFEEVDALVLAYENAIEAQNGAVSLLWGDLKPKGHLPVTASDLFSYGLGLSFE